MLKSGLRIFTTNQLQKEQTMYLKSVLLENVGPIDSINLRCWFTEKGNLPIPLVLVGANGSGKSYLASCIVNPLITARSSLVKDSEIVSGGTFKTRDLNQIRYEQSHMFEELSYTNGLHYSELMLDDIKKQYIKNGGEHLKYDNFSEMDSTSNFCSVTNFFENTPNTEHELLTSMFLYFPPNRFEDPIWLNKQALNYGPNENIKTVSNTSFQRHIINNASLNVNKDWLFNLIADSYCFENWQSKSVPTNFHQLVGNKRYPATVLLIQIENFLKQMFEIQGEIRWDLGSRINRRIGFYVNSKQVTHDLFALSTGQVLILNLFLSIIRDCDYISSISEQDIGDIQGIVVLEDIDLHLHPRHQFELLPKIMKYFPHIQFVITTHSPIFLMGIEQQYPNDSVQIVDVESGTVIESQYFSELQSTLFYFQESKFFKNKLQEFSESAKECIVFVEGITDKQYIEKAAKLHKKQGLLERIEIVEVEGKSKLNSLWNLGSKFLNAHLNKKCILLYDCDANKAPEELDKLFVRCVNKFEDHVLTHGIENLFSEKTINNVIKKFGNVIEKNEKTRGEKVSFQAKFYDKKTEICNWLCKSGNFSDFKNFDVVFDIIEEVIAKYN